MFVFFCQTWGHRVPNRGTPNTATPDGSLAAARDGHATEPARRRPISQTTVRVVGFEAPQSRVEESKREAPCAMVSWTIYADEKWSRKDCEPRSDCWEPTKWTIGYQRGRKGVVLGHEHSTSAGNEQAGPGIMNRQDSRNAAGPLKTGQKHQSCRAISGYGRLLL